MTGMFGISAAGPMRDLWNIQSSHTDRASFGTYVSGSPYEEPEDKDRKTLMDRQMRELIRGLKRQESKASDPVNNTNPFQELTGSTEETDKEESKKPVTYNYKEIATRIRLAKTSVGAEQAYISAKRKVNEIKRKIGAGDGDPEELQFALTHAKRMEMAARKKKHHLELEELAERTRKRDEEQDKLEEASNDMKNAMYSAEEVKVSEREDEIFEEREDMIHEAAQDMKERRSSNTDKLLKELNEMVARFGEEELEELEETMELLEDMEIIDPHMSEDDFNKLKRKHRSDEEKAMIKADMDYLKDMIKHQQETGGAMPGMGSSGMAASFAAGLTSGMEFAPVDVTGVDSPAVDVSV